MSADEAIVFSQITFTQMKFIWPFIIATICIITTSCSDNPQAGLVDATSVINELTIDVTPQQEQTRSWSGNATIHRIVGLSDDSPLFHPIGVVVDSKQNIYISDFGDYKIKKFTPSGDFVLEMGTGIGNAPSQFSNMLDMKIIGDSLIAVSDRANRRITIFKTETGEYHSTIPTENPSSRIAFSDEGRVFALLTRHEKLFDSFGLNNPDDLSQIGKISNEHLNNNMLFSGMINSIGEDIIYLPSFMPLLIRFGPTGETKFARYTIDPGSGLGAMTSTTVSGSSRTTRISGKRLHGFVMLNEDELHVHALSDPEDEFTSIDVYDPNSGSYKYSYRIPGFFPYVWSTSDHFYATNDSSLVIGSF